MKNPFRGVVRPIFNSHKSAHGPHCFERGQTFFATARKYAEGIGARFAWELETVPGVGHSNRKMAPAAAKLLAADNSPKASQTLGHDSFYRHALVQGPFEGF
jgi:hypothetical protein